jgi:hypothetical protein
MSHSQYSAEQILQELDAGATDFYFPMLDNGFIYSGGVRLTAFRDDRRWAIVIETLGFHYKVGFPEGLSTDVAVFGNGLAASRPEYPSQAITCEQYDRPKDQFIGFAPPDLKEVFVRGVRVHVPRQTSSYQAKGIDVKSVQELEGQHVLRVLLPECRDLLLTPEEELRRYVAPDLPFFLRLSEWYHPDLANGELPSASSTFCLLAKALVSGDPNRYRPPLPPNTDWRNWPEGGAL